MTLLKRNGNLLNQLPVLFDDFINRDTFNWGLSNFSNSNTTIPAVNIKETNESYQVEVAAPGMLKNDFKVELEGNLLTISSEKRGDNEEVEGVCKTAMLEGNRVLTFEIQALVVDSVYSLAIL